MTEVLFYHLQNQPLEQVLPGLLEKCLERNWRAVVQLGSEERRDALDAHLWTYRDDGFLPHGTAKDGHAAGAAGVADGRRTTIRTAPRCAFSPTVLRRRTIPTMSGSWCSSTATIRTRSTGRGPHGATTKAAGHDATYWQQSERGRWEKKA